MLKLRSFRPAGAGRFISVAAISAAVTMVTLHQGEAQTRRVDSRSLSCAQVQSMIKQQGAVLLSTGQYTFDRYVSNRNQCQHGEVLRRDTVPTKDSDRCRVQRCIEDFRFNSN